jgi:uncharacterized protein YndB with AHSA1/START domain
MSTTFPPVVKKLLVKATPEHAFRRFTAEMGSWWPLRSHSVFEGEADRVTFEGRVGGRIVESTPDGRESVWGTVKAWDPPRRVAFTWHPGHATEKAQDVEVTFTPEGERTRVQLTHTGFERLGAKDGRFASRAYGIGWEYVFGLYAERQGLVMGLLGALTNLMLAVRDWRRPKQARAERREPAR